MTIRELDWESALGKKVQIYRNVRAGRMTIRDPRHKVLGHVSNCVLENVVFRFCERLQQKSQATGRKTPHAWGLGTLIAQFPEDIGLEFKKNPELELSYNHKIHPYFYLKDGRDTPVWSCKYLMVHSCRVTVVSPNCIESPN
ncbi:hypothetical protein [Thermoleptolyngbya sp.]